MAGQPHTPRVGIALPIKDEHIGDCVQLRQRCQHHRPLAKREQARHIGKGHLTLAHHSLDLVERRQCMYRHRSACAPLPEPHINAGHQAHLVQGVAMQQSCGEVALYLRCLARRHIPAMTQHRREHGQPPLWRHPHYTPETMPVRC